MGLKQSIIIKSEYTNNARSNQGKGSRGASPGQYVMRYMAREDATEVLGPVRIDDYDSMLFTRYMIRSTATEVLKNNDMVDMIDNDDAHGSPLLLKHRFRQIDKLSGRAFGKSNVSLSHRELEDASKRIQDAFDSGHSVQKIVFSFTEDYLREMNVVNPQFKHKGRGSYKGHVDQLKLRMAITEGIEQMTKVGRFIDPVWVATVQLDTSHVHAHVALVDTVFSASRMKPDGADRGKINDREKHIFRKAMNNQLQDMSSLHSFYAQTSIEKQNVVAFVKDYAYSTIHQNTAIQLLVASLPKSRKDWRYGSHSKAMKHPNALATSIIEQVFEEQPDKSGYTNAITAVYNYADNAEIKYKLTAKEKQKRIDVGRDRIIERSVNGLYKTLQTIDPALLHIRTPMTDIQSTSNDDLAQALKKSTTDRFDPSAFMLRVRGYSSRQSVHTQKAQSFYTLIESYDQAQEQGFVNPTAHVMRVFYEEELRQHMGLSDKYRKFLSFHHDDDVRMVSAFTPRYESLLATYQQLQDNSSTDSNTVAIAEYKRELKAYTFDAFEKGVASLKEWDAIIDYDQNTGDIKTRFVSPIRPKTKVDNLTDTHFNHVKAWDVHHLGLDYYNQPDARIDEVNTLAFASVYQSRLRAAKAARIYVDQTNQILPELKQTEADIDHMSLVVNKAIDEGRIQTVSLNDLTDIEEKQLYTIAVDRSVNVVKEVRRTLQDIEPDVLE